jgi:hypothetical protein
MTSVCLGNDPQRGLLRVLSVDGAYGGGGEGGVHLGLAGLDQTKGTKMLIVVLNRITPSKSASNR